jgi:hypothetical protein
VEPDQSRVVLARPFGVDRSDTLHDVGAASHTYTADSKLSQQSSPAHRSASKKLRRRLQTLQCKPTAPHTHQPLWSTTALMLSSQITLLRSPGAHLEALPVVAADSPASQNVKSDSKAPCCDKVGIADPVTASASIEQHTVVNTGGCLYHAAAQRVMTVSTPQPK